MAKILLSLCISIVFILMACTAEQERFSFLQVKGDRIIDSADREVILNGINHVVKDPKKQYVYAADEQLFKNFRIYGFNCVRYGIIGDGLELEPGVINEEYLKEIDKRVKWAEENGIWLVLDMHQNLYGRKFSDGAPQWATLDDGLSHQSGNVWSDSYLISPAVQRAFDNFWNNKPASDGKGVQDHYLEVWRVLAERYKDAPSVAGFDIMNEPFMGVEAQDVFRDLLKGYAEGTVLQGGKLPNMNQLLTAFGSEASRIELLESLNDKELYRTMTGIAGHRVKAFEEQKLSAFYQRARDIIRGTGSKQLLFLEHSYFCNMGIPSYFTVPRGTDNRKDPNSVYAPHGYDLVTDTDAADNPDYSRTGVIFEQIFKNGENKQLPVWIGEWGAFYKGKDYRSAASYIIQMIEQRLAGQTYWCWWPQIEDQDYFKIALSRPYPMAVAGKLKSYTNTEARFVCKWNEQAGETEGNCFFVPKLSLLEEHQLQIEPLSAYRIEPIAGGQSGYLIVTPCGKNVDRYISFPSLN